MDKHMYKIIDNLIPLSYQNELEKELNDSHFPYYFTPTINQNYKNQRYLDENITDAPGWTHLVFDPEKNNFCSFLYPKIKPILLFLEKKENIEIDKIVRIRIRRTTQIPGHNLKKYTPPHVDLKYYEKDYYSLVYYVEDTDGDTVLFKDLYDKKTDSVMYDKGEILTRVSPKKGRALFFKGLVFHSGNCPVNFVKRTIINFDFTLKN
jgi:hypothetical protein